MKTIKETMLQTMVKIYGKVSAQQKENGKSLFGDGTFVIYGQCTGVYYAALYTENNPLNPYYHDKTVLQKAIKSWDYYLTLLNEEGQTHIITYDHSWGYMYEEWNTLHLLNTIHLLKDALSREKFQEYEKAVHCSVRGIFRETKRDFESGTYRKNVENYTVANHFLWCIALCYRYGQLYQDQKMMNFCQEVMTDVCRHQLPFGTWLEGGSLVVEYAHTSLGALALFSHYSGNQNKEVYQAVLANINYLLKCYYDNFSPIGCIDTRNRYEYFNGFPYIPGAFVREPAGLQFAGKHVRGLSENPFYLLNSHQMLGFFTASYYSVPEDVLLPEKQETSSEDCVIEIDRLEHPILSYSENNCNSILIKEKGFTIPVCILTQKLYHSRWILERQNLFSIYHRDAGLIVGGGHSIADPRFSCFNVISGGKLFYMHEKAHFISAKQIVLSYGGVSCNIKIHVANENIVTVQYQAEGLMDTQKVLVHVPVFSRYAKRISISNQADFIPEDLTYRKHKLLAGEQLEIDRNTLSMDRPFYAEYPVFAYNSYVQEQVEEFKNAFFVLHAELDDKHPCVTLTVKI